MNYIEKDLSYYIDRLKQSPFSLARYGDAEWLHLMGRRKPDQVTGGSHHTFFPELGEDLRKTILNPIIANNYIYATHKPVPKLQTMIDEYINVNNIEIQWYEGNNIFHNALKDGKLFPLIKFLRTTKNIIVGPGSLRSLHQRVIPYTHFIETPNNNCYLELREIKANVLECCYDNCIIFISGSLAGKVLVYQLYSVIGDKCFIIDMGSIWDILLGNLHRAFWRFLRRDKPLQYKRIINMNLGKINGCNT